MRFLWVEHHPVFGGPHNRAMRLNAPLAERGWETLVLLPEGGGSAEERLREAGVPVVTLPLHRLRGGRDLRVHAGLAAGFVPEVGRIRSLVREHDVDLVVNVALENPHSAIAGRLERRPVVWQFIGTITPMAFRRAMMPLVRGLADVLMTTGMTIARDHPGATAFGPRLFPFFSPVDVDAYRPDPGRRASARAELGLGTDDVVIGNVGNLNPQKGHRTFVQAAARIRKTHPDVRFAILGARHDTHQEYEESLWEEAERLGLRLGEDLVVASPGSRVGELAPAFDVFWMTSVPRSEGVPTVVMEAAAMGLPVVATDVGGVREVVSEEETGFVVPPLEPDRLAAATRPILDDEPRRLAMSEAARRMAVERFRTEICVDTHVRAFEAAVAHRRARAGD